MRHILMLLAVAVLVVDEDVYTISLLFEKMHCEECKSTVEANLKTLKNVSGVKVEGDVASVFITEGAPVDLAKVRRCVPADLKLKAVALVARGTVAAKGNDLSFTMKDSAVAMTLANRDEKPKPKDDKIADLKKAMDGKNRFEINGELRERNKSVVLIVDGFKKAEWKEK